MERAVTAGRVAGGAPPLAVIPPPVPARPAKRLPPPERAHRGGQALPRAGAGTLRRPAPATVPRPARLRWADAAWTGAFPARASPAATARGPGPASRATARPPSGPPGRRSGGPRRGGAVGRIPAPPDRSRARGPASPGTATPSRGRGACPPRAAAPRTPPD